MMIQQAMQALENVMLDSVASDVKTLHDASRHILEAGGKRVRPRLMLLTYLACGGTAVENVLSAAAAVELVHTASVVHDDINDHGVVRRGRPSVNALWGRTFALLTGDFLFTKVYELMAPYKDLNVILSEATVALVEGETLQASAVKENNFSRQVYYDIISRKTAALFRSAAHMGAALAGAGEATIEALRLYGFNVGLAFQIIDDVLDLTADSEQLGKTSGIDLQQGRGYAVAYAGNGETKTQAAVAEQPTDPLTAIKAKMLSRKAIEEAYTQANMLRAAAVASLDVLPESPYKDALVDLARLVVERDH
ncbi:MAG: polyprenyl synthetase family protein [Anaerolineaceae bacterium]|nr:polyprenyl synthetase family protein [Anaerolineaceae bacterium]